MKDDTISRQAVLDAVEGVDWYHQNKNGEMVHGANSDEHQAWYKADDIYAAIDSAPSAQPVEDVRAMCGECDAWNQYKNPQTGWIPCNERLPGKDESFYVLCCDKYGEIMIGNVFECYDGETPYSAESENEYMYDCVAWMPLPTPYREGRQNNGKN